MACLMLLHLLPGAFAPSLAATDELPVTGIVPVIEAGKRIYSPAQFARFAPQNAADIVQQIPGFSVIGVSNNRGLGEATQNVLIDGQRITGKGNDAMTVLRRIPVRAVLGLEIVDGASLDIGGLSGDVLNVLTQQSAVQGNFTWRPVIRERIEDHWPGAEASISGTTGLGNFGLGLKWDGFRGGGWGRTEEVRSDGNTVWRYVDPLFANDVPELSGTFNRVNPGGSIWNLNFSVERENFRNRSLTRFQRPGGASVTETSFGRNRKWRTEFGSDYEFALGDGRLKLVGLVSQFDGPNRNEISTLEDGSSIPQGSRFTRDSTEGERVLRGEYRWKALDADWTLSAEGAYNFVDAEGALEVRDETGAYQARTLAGATSRVEEVRGESILNYSASINGDWSLKLSGGGEYSRLRQDGEGGLTRSFWRPKGSVALAWSPESAWTLNFKLQRAVQQLNFFDFLASVDVQNDNANTGNPQLVPPQSWLAQVEAVGTLGRHGNVTLTLEAEDISDLVAQVPTSPTQEAPGNLPSARRLQLKLDAGFLLDEIGIPGGKLDVFGNVRDTRLRDELDGRHREFNGNRYYWNVDFRHDVPGTSWTWGLFSEWQATNHFYRLDFEEHFTPARPYVQAFVEHKDVFGLKVRVAVGNLLRNYERTQQAFYTDRRDGPVDYTRDYRLRFGHIYRLQVSGTF